MFRLRATAMYVFVTLSPPLVVSAAAQTSNLTAAEAWRTFDNTNKLLYLRGLGDGATMSEVLIVYLYNNESIRDLYFVKSPAPRISFDSAARLQTDHLTSLAGGRLQAVADVMNQLYQEPANACITFMGVAIIAIRKLDGMSQPGVDSLQTLYRRSLAQGCLR